eukprot:6186246-Pleurochrysis_carterae.AAC.5
MRKRRCRLCATTPPARKQDRALRRDCSAQEIVYFDGQQPAIETYVIGHIRGYVERNAFIDEAPALVRFVFGQRQAARRLVATLYFGRGVGRQAVRINKLCRLPT